MERRKICEKENRNDRNSQIYNEDVIKANQKFARVYKNSKYYNSQIIQNKD